MSGNPSQSEGQQQPKPETSSSAPSLSTAPQTTPTPRPATSPTPTAKKESEGPLLFHFAECTNCHHILPISTTTEKYFPILTKDPKSAVGLGEKCARCGADSWKLVIG